MKRWLKNITLIGVMMATVISLSACGDKQNSSSGKKSYY